MCIKNLSWTGWPFPLNWLTVKPLKKNKNILKKYLQNLHISEKCRNFVPWLKKEYLPPLRCGKQDGRIGDSTPKDQRDTRKHAEGSAARRQKGRKREPTANDQRNDRKQQGKRRQNCRLPTATLKTGKSHHSRRQRGWDSVVPDVRRTRDSTKATKLAAENLS